MPPLADACALRVAAAAPTHDAQRAPECRARGMCAAALRARRALPLFHCVPPCGRQRPADAKNNTIIGNSATEIGVTDYTNGNDIEQNVATNNLWFYYRACTHSAPASAPPPLRAWRPCPGGRARVRRRRSARRGGSRGLTLPRARAEANHNEVTNNTATNLIVENHASMVTMSDNRVGGTKRTASTCMRLSARGRGARRQLMRQTHSCTSPVRLPRLLGMMPLSWLL